jgi:hypothetical protein
VTCLDMSSLLESLRVISGSIRDGGWLAGYAAGLDYPVQVVAKKDKMPLTRKIRTAANA